MANPFAVVSPEEMKAEKAAQLFVEMYSDYPQIKRPGNIIMTGARGCGKTMLIRCCSPDVLMLKDNKRLDELEYLAFHIPVKKTSLCLSELRFLENRHAPYLINEHFLVLNLLMYSLLDLSVIEYPVYEPEAYKKFFENTYSRYLRMSGCKNEIKVNYESPKDFFLSLYHHAEEMQADFIGYILRLNPNSDKLDPAYDLPLLSFLRFVVPVFKDLINLPGFRQNANIYFFIDDADNLSITQTKILNTWIACRTQPTISLKVSAQYELYKTYLTSNDILIESPHDYQSVNISLRYTTNYIGKFKDKAIEILAKRLSSAGIEQTPEKFFPAYSIQEDGIQREIQLIRDNYTISGRGTRVDDDIRRYAIPNYIKKLGGTKKSRSTFRYAGLENMIHLSSGIIRNLLDAAANMYDAACAQCGEDTPIAFIDTGIQNRVLRNQSDAFLYTELRHSNTGYADTNELQPIASPKNDIEKLQNLICAMGQTFHDILVSDRSERKVFSIALSNAPDDEIKRVLKTGVRLGYLHEATIGNKAGNGRTWLYILNRRLAPSFVLDPTGFQGYLFMTNDDLHRAMTTGRQLRVIDDRLDGDVEQLSLFDIWED